MATFTPDSKAWFDLSDQDKEAVIEGDFIQKYGKDPKFTNSDPSEQKAYRQAHRQWVEETALESEYNPSNQRRIENQRDANTSGFMENTFDIAVESVSGLPDQAKLVNDVYPDGTVDPDFAKDLSKSLQKQREKRYTQDQKEFGKDVAVLQKEWDQGDGWDKFKAIAKFLGTVPSNTKGIIQTGAESISSLVAIGAGAKAGGSLGPVGAAAGMLAAETYDAATHKLRSQISEEMEKQGYKETETNIIRFLENNPKFLKEAQTKSVEYGAVLGLVDLATAGMFTRISTLGTRTARRAATRNMTTAQREAIETVAKQKNINPDKLINAAIDEQAIAIYKQRPFRKKVKGGALALGGETLSEPLSEGVATASIDEEVRIEDLVYEAAGGLGASPIGAAINVSALGSKAGSKKSAEFAKKLLSPEARAQAENLNNQAKAVKNQDRTRTSHKYKEEVEKTDINDTKVDEWADPEHKNYDPIKAIDVLAKEASIESTDRIKDIEHKAKLKLQEHYDRQDELSEKIESKKITTAEVEEAKVLTKQLIPRQEAIVTKLRKQKEKVNEQLNKESNTKESTKINPAEATSEEVVNNISETFGSLQNRNQLSEVQTERLKQNENINDDTKSLLEANREAEEARRELNKSSQQTATDTDSDKSTKSKKTMGEVQNDIYSGVNKSEFKGINSYKQGISHYLNPKINKPEAALNELKNLKRFRDEHKKKSDLFNKAFETAKNTKESTPQKIKFNGFTYKIHKGSGKLVNSLPQEVEVMNKEIKAAEALLRAKGVLKAGQPTSKPTNTPQESSSQAERNKKVADEVNAFKNAEFDPDKAKPFIDAAKKKVLPSGIELTDAEATKLKKIIEYKANNRKKQVEKEVGTFKNTTFSPEVAQPFVDALEQKKLPSGTKLTNAEAIKLQKIIDARTNKYNKEQEKSNTENHADQKKKEIKTEEEQLELDFENEPTDPLLVQKSSVKPKEKTDKQKAALKRAKTINPTKDNIIQAISKLGGIDFKQALAEWGKTLTDDTTLLNRLGGNVTLPVIRKKNGKSLDRMREDLVEYGYLDSDSTIEDLYTALSESLNGKIILAKEGNYDISPEEEAAFYADQDNNKLNEDIEEVPFEINDQPITDDQVIDSGYFDLNNDEQAVVNAAIPEVLNNENENREELNEFLNGSDQESTSPESRESQESNEESVEAESEVETDVQSPEQMLVTYEDIDGNKVTKPQHEAIREIVEARKEAERIRICINRLG